MHPVAFLHIFLAMVQPLLHLIVPSLAKFTGFPIAKEDHLDFKTFVERRLTWSEESLSLDTSLG